jgi:hypothetical protein
LIGARRAVMYGATEGAVQKLGREKHYLEYSVQVCTLDREAKFEAKEAAA